MTFKKTILCVGYSIILAYLSSCTINRAYTNGQEGLETVYKPKQIRAEVDYFGGPGIGAFHADVSYSPINKVAILYDVKSAGVKHMYHTLAVGLYTSNYKPYVLKQYVGNKTTIDIGRHFDLYGGMSYGFAKQVIIPEGNSFTNFNDTYELNFYAKRYFIQGGAHFKSKDLGFDFVFRRLWVDVDKIELFGLLPDSNINPENDFRNSSILPYIEFGMKVNFVGNYKPLYIGFNKRFGDNTPFTASAFASSTAFIGANIDIHLLFKKSKASEEILDYKYEEE
jgi:hypothetical protein